VRIVNAGDRPDRRRLWQYVVVLTSQASLVAILIGGIIAVVSEPTLDGPVGLAIAVLGVAAAAILVGLALWLHGTRVVLLVVDLVIFGVTFRSFVVRLFGADASGAMPIGIGAFCAGIGVLASRWFDPAREGRSATPVV
jgi:hypothetical protein